MALLLSSTASCAAQRGRHSCGELGTAPYRGGSSPTAHPAPTAPNRQDRGCGEMLDSPRLRTRGEGGSKAPGAWGRCGCRPCWKGRLEATTSPRGRGSAEQDRDAHLCCAPQPTPLPRDAEPEEEVRTQGGDGAASPPTAEGATVSPQLARCTHQHPQTPTSLLSAPGVLAAPRHLPPGGHSDTGGVAPTPRHRPPSTACTLHHCSAH